MAPRRLENDAEERRKESVRRETGDGKKTMEPFLLYWQLTLETENHSNYTVKEAQLKRTRFQNAER